MSDPFVQTPEEAAAVERRDAEIRARRALSNGPGAVCGFCGTALSVALGEDREWVGRFNGPLCDYHTRVLTRSAT